MCYILLLDEVLQSWSVLTANKKLNNPSKSNNLKKSPVNSMIHVLLSLSHTTHRQTIQKHIYLSIFAVAFLSCGRRSGSLKTSSSKFNTFIFSSLFSSKSCKGKQFYFLFVLTILIKQLKKQFFEFCLFHLLRKYLMKLGKLLQ